MLAGSSEPLRAGNFDFNLVGPDWLSVLSFTALAVFQGVLTVSLAARLSRGVPSREPGPRVLLVGRLALAGARAGRAALLRRRRRRHPQRLSAAATEISSASEPGGPVSCIPFGSTHAGRPTRSCGAV